MDSSSHRIRVDVVTQFVEDQSSPVDGRFVFAYTITIRNEGSVPARLLSRFPPETGLQPSGTRPLPVSCSVPFSFALRF